MNSKPQDLIIILRYSCNADKRINSSPNSALLAATHTNLLTDIASQLPEAAGPLKSSLEPVTQCHTIGPWLTGHSDLAAA